MAKNVFWFAFLQSIKLYVCKLLARMIIFKGSACNSTHYSKGKFKIEKKTFYYNLYKEACLFPNNLSLKDCFVEIEILYARFAIIYSYEIYLDIYVSINLLMHVIRRS